MWHDERNQADRDGHRDEPRDGSEPGAPRPYAPPRLVRYGSIVDLTAAQHPTAGSFDGQVKAPGNGKQFFMKSF